MSLSSDRGFLILNGLVLDTKGIQKLSGISPKKFRKVFQELTSFGIIKQDEEGRFYSKRMVNDEHLRQVRREVGKKGGNPNLKKKDKQGVEGLVQNLVNQTDNQNSTLSKSKSKVNKKNKYFFNEEGEGLNQFNPVNEYIQKNCPNVAKLSSQMTNDEVERLLLEYTFEKITLVLDSMENYKPLVKKYSSVNLTLKNWLKNANHDKSNSSNTRTGKPDFENAIRNF
jgi:hypothetical protein